MLMLYFGHVINFFAEIVCSLNGKLKWNQKTSSLKYGEQNSLQSKKENCERVHNAIPLIEKERKGTENY